MCDIGKDKFVEQDDIIKDLHRGEAIPHRPLKDGKSGKFRSGEQRLLK